jgi:hypothetical protein
MSPFLEFQMAQQAAITISLKIDLPKLVLASIIMSRGGRIRSQIMPIELQQERLKGRSKNKCMLVSSTLALQMA